MPEREKKRVGRDRTANFRTPELCGGIFSIDKEFFFKTGGYDDKMTFYAAENIEMVSIKSTIQNVVLIRIFL